MSETTKYIETVNFNYANRGLALSVLDSIVNTSQRAIAASPWSPFRSFAKSTVLSILKRLEHGRLTLKCVESGEVHEFGGDYILPERIDGKERPLVATIKIFKEESFWTRMFLHHDFGFADAYMLGEIEVDLHTIFRIFILNRKKLSEFSTLISPVIRTLSYISNMRLANGLKGSKSNISAHYDLSNDVFAAFLSWDMTYSCGVFDEEAGGAFGDLLKERPIAPPRQSYNATRTIPADDLERSQIEKLHIIARGARIKKGSHVLEIGCGWGSFAILAAGTYGATVEAITISDEQKRAIDKNIADAGLSHMITVHVVDYRDMPQSFHKSFDAVVSIGVMEHVGVEFMQGWFEKMSWAMKPLNSFKVLTMSTVPDTRWSQYATEVDFVRKYIYPGGQLSSIKTLVNDITAAGLNVESIQNIGPHYARTLREWRYRFERNFQSHIKPALRVQYPELTDEDLEIFRRKWIYYFAYSEAGFAMRSISDSVIVATREANLNV